MQQFIQPLHKQEQDLLREPKIKGRYRKPLRDLVVKVETGSPHTRNCMAHIALGLDDALCAERSFHPTPQRS